MSFRLLNLIKMLDKKGIKTIDIYLDKNIELLTKLKNGELEQFLNYYLSFRFDITNNKPFSIFKYIKISNYLKLSDLKHTNYFHTMPSEYVIEAIRLSSSDEGFVNYLISKLDKENLERITGLIILGGYSEIKEYRLPALLSKLKKYHNINNLYIFYWHFKSMKKDFLNLLFESYTNEEIKAFALLHNSFAEIKEIIHTLIYNGKIDLAFDIINDMRKNEKDESGFPFMNRLFKRDIYLIFAEYAKDNFINLESIEDKIIKSDNYDLMYYWVITNNGPKKYELLDKMLVHEDLNLGKLVLSLDERYVKYVLEKICEQESNNKLNNMFKEIFSFINNNTIYQIDTILSILFIIRPSYKLSKCACITLLGYNTKHYNYLINNYEYTVEERNEILENINLIGNYSLLAIYGSYYLTGDKNCIADESIIKENSNVLKRLRSTNL